LENTNGFHPDEQPRVFTTENLVAASEMDALIAAAYRQVFHEQQMLNHNRQAYLESQLRSGQITVKQFIAGLATSDSFRRLNFDVNNNYRFVELCVQRLLGRNTYSEREKIAWSAVVMTKGVKGFVDELLNSEEYLHAFGEHMIPYQRRRILAQRSKGELPFERMARYGTDFRNRLPRPSRNTSSLSTAGQADGLFTQFEPFELDALIRRGNWGVVAGLGILFCALLLLGFAVSTAV
jgi:phycobilisome rod-core linker protein